MNFNRLFGLGTLVVVAGGLIAAFTVLGTPGHQRRISLDDRRVADLYKIASSLHERYPSGKVPASLPQDFVAYDPITERPYGFRRVDNKHFALCATFTTIATVHRGDPIFEEVWNSSLVRQNDWPHPAGYTCYAFDVTASEPAPRRI